MLSGLGKQPAAGPSSSNLAHAFAVFVNAIDAKGVQAAYDDLLAGLGVQNHATSPSLATLSALLANVLPHRSRQLLVTLGSWRDAHSTAALTCPSGEMPLRVAVVGAGPIGLRAAIELAASGADVEVLEGRENFSRLQVVHLWEMVEADLIELGVKLIDPSIFAAVDLRRVQVCQLQHSLLKVAMLLGVRVRFGCRIDAPADLHRHMGARGGVDVLVDASGARCALLETIGFTQTLALRSARALCLVVSLVNRRTTDEHELRESTWSAQYFPQLFGALAEQGVALENLVYYQSTGKFSAAATHYFLMTTDIASLHAFGALIDPSTVHAHDGTPVDPCRASNVRHFRLEAYARAAIKAFVAPLAQHPLVSGERCVVFDFSTRYTSNRAAAIVPSAIFGSSSRVGRAGGAGAMVGAMVGSGAGTDAGTDAGGAPQPTGGAPTAAPGASPRAVAGGALAPCLVTRVGDALQEPFWPEVSRRRSNPPERPRQQHSGAVCVCRL